MSGISEYRIQRLFCFYLKNERKAACYCSCQRASKVLTQSPQTLTYFKQINVYLAFCSLIFIQVAIWLTQAVQIRQAANASIYLNKYVGYISSQANCLKTKS